MFCSDVKSNKMRKEFQGKTVEEAVEVACHELNLSRDDFSYEIKEMPTKGFLGIGAKNAVITVTVNDDPVSYLSDYLKELFGFMNATDYTESIEITEDKLINIQLNGECLNQFTEKHSDIVDAIQFMLAITVNKKYDEHYKVTFNINDYKEKSVSRVEAVAVKAAKSVQKTRRKVILFPMSAYQRRIVHSKLQGFDNITTYSIGTEPERKVVVAYQYAEGEARPVKGGKNGGKGRRNYNNNNSENVEGREKTEGSENRYNGKGRNGYRSNGGRYNGRNSQNRGSGRNYDGARRTENVPAAPQQSKIKLLYQGSVDGEGSEE